MSCIVTFTTLASGDDPKKGQGFVRRGAEPLYPVDWEVKAWFVLANKEKHTHSITVRQECVLGLVPFVGALIDSLVEDLGQEVHSAGWTAMTHGKSKRRGTRHGKKR